MSKVQDELDEYEDAEVIDDPELNEELEASIAEADRGEFVDGDEFLRRLRNGEYASWPRTNPSR